MHAPVLSVVIPCGDDVAHLREALSALEHERLDVPWEVVVADNGSRDGARAVAEEFADRLRLRIVDATAHRGPWFARNTGAAAAQGEHLVFLDSDDVIAPGYLARMHEALAGADLVASRQDGERLNPGWVARSRPLGLIEGLNDYLGFLPYASSCCLGVRRGAFEALGGFAELRIGEDVDLCWRGQLRGMTLRVAPGAVLHYRFRSTIRGTFRQAVEYGGAHVLLYRRFRGAGMPRRGVRDVAREWRYSVRRLVRARTKSDLAEALYLLGILTGRALGSVRHRVGYL
jgi:glycosyltransferase involved in cell wall biosynthesis